MALARAIHDISVDRDLESLYHADTDREAPP
jgi:hypothetical protein